MINVGTLKTKLTPKLHGTSLKKVADIFNLLHEAASTMLLRIDPPDTVQRFRIGTAIYDRVYNYTAPTDLKGTDRIVDIRPIGPRDRHDSTDQTFVRQFDIRKDRDSLTVENIAGVKTLRISKCIGPVSLLEGFDVLDSTIVTGGDITSPVIDSLDYVSGNGSLSFGLSGATGVGTVTITLPQAMDLTTLLNLGSLFGWFKFPDATRFTSFVLKWGSDASNYWSQTITIPQGRTAVDSNAWDLMPAPWVSATPTGSPVVSTVKYLQVTINYTTGVALSYVKLDSITASLGKAYEMLYYSQFLFRDAITGVLKEIPTSDTDIIVIDSAATNIFFYEFWKLVAQQIKGKNMATDMQLINYMLEGDGRVIRSMLIANRQGLYRDYIAENPSQAIPSQTVYHEFDDCDGY